LGISLDLIEEGGRPHLYWNRNHAKVLLLGHIDTVWPVGTIDEVPFELSDGWISGPGVFDMKGGVIMMLMAAASLLGPEMPSILITSDEELGSAASRPLIEEMAKASSSVLVFEPSAPGGALKVARKGICRLDMEFVGRAAHAGLEPELGINALTAMAQIVTQMPQLADTSMGTSVTPTLARAGTTANTVPERATLHLDIRSYDEQDLTRVESAIRMLSSQVEGVVIDVSGGKTRPPLGASASEDLFAQINDLAKRLGQHELKGSSVGGVSDGNLTAHLGVPTLDGLGAIGEGAHARSERINLPATLRRLDLIAKFLDQLLEAERVD
jgi:glutamate carboxypeptidase